MVFTIQTFVRKVMFLLLNMLFRFVMAFLPRSKHLLISWLLSPSSVIWELRKIVSVAIPTFFPFLPFFNASRSQLNRFHHPWLKNTDLQVKTQGCPDFFLKPNVHKPEGIHSSSKVSPSSQFPIRLTVP